MLSGPSSLQSATHARQSGGRAAGRCNAIMNERRRGKNCRPDVPTEALIQHILQQLASDHLGSLTAVQLAKLYDTHEIRSRLTEARLVEKDPAATGTKPAWRLTDEGRAAAALSDASHTAAVVDLETLRPALEHQQSDESSLANAAAMPSRTASAVIRVSGQPSAGRMPPAVGDTCNTTSSPGSSCGMVVAAAAINAVTAPISNVTTAQCASSDHNNSSAVSPGSGSGQTTHPSAVECLTAAFGQLWAQSAAVTAPMMQTSRNQSTDTRPALSEAQPSQALESCTLPQNPVKFKQLFQAAYKDKVQPAPAELQAAMDSIHSIVQRLQQDASIRSTARALQLDNIPVTIDRVCIAGSVGKRTCVSGSFDVDLILFVNLPPAYLQQVSAVDPDSTHRSNWMQQLREQLHQYCVYGNRLPQLVDCNKGPSAVSCQLVVGGPQRGYPHLYVKVDLVLAPNLAGAAADKPAAQCAAVLEPLLAAGTAWSATNSARPASSSSSSSSGPKSQGPPVPSASYARAIWLQEATTEYVRAAAATLVQLSTGEVASTVVTDTMALTKAWVRKGLQRGEGATMEYTQLKGFMIELLVLKAAEKWCQLLPQQQQSSSSRSLACSAAASSTGRHMLDLFLFVLEEAQRWAGIADTSKCASLTGGDPRPILFTDVPCVSPNGRQVRYYTKEQAWGLQMAATVSEPSTGWTRGERCFAQPVVVHPVDPLDNIFSQRRFSLPMWQMFKDDAKTLHQQLHECSWEYIRTESSLAAVLA